VIRLARSATRKLTAQIMIDKGAFVGKADQ
jgi:hypothetical protein